MQCPKNAPKERVEDDAAVLNDTNGATHATEYYVELRYRVFGYRIEHRQEY
jgi:hypothetical protein